MKRRMIKEKSFRAAVAHGYWMEGDPTLVDDQFGA